MSPPRRKRGEAPVDLFGGHHEAHKAEQRSINDWANEARRLFGERYGNWELAQGKDVHCNVRGAEFVCVAAANPCRDYPLDKFLEDWGPKGPHGNIGAMKIIKTQHCKAGIIRTFEWGPKDTIPLWVNRGDLVLSYAPWPVCDFTFQMPAK